MIACLLLLCGSSVYVQKKSCSFGSNGGAIVSTGSARNRAGVSAFLDLAVVIVEVEAGIFYQSMPITQIVQFGRCMRSDERYISSDVGSFFSSTVSFQGSSWVRTNHCARVRNELSKNLYYDP